MLRTLNSAHAYRILKELPPPPFQQAMLYLMMYIPIIARNYFEGDGGNELLNGVVL